MSGKFANVLIKIINNIKIAFKTCTNSMRAIIEHYRTEKITNKPINFNS